jgi:chromosome segregation ATPase
VGDPVRVDLDAAERLARYLEPFPNYPDKQARETIRDLVAEVRRYESNTFVQEAVAELARVCLERDELRGKLAGAEKDLQRLTNDRNSLLDDLETVEHNYEGLRDTQSMFVRELEALRAVERAARAVGCGYDEVSPISVALIALDALRKGTP